MLEPVKGWGLVQVSSMDVLKKYDITFREDFAVAALTRLQDLVNFATEKGLDLIPCVWGANTQKLLEIECDTLLPSYVERKPLLRQIFKVPHPQSGFDKR